MPDYEFDVFVSYENDHLMTQWVVEEFMPLFRTLVRQEIGGRTGRATRLFFAYKQEDFPNLPHDFKAEVVGIPLGVTWEEALDSAIRKSRCMVGLWNPTYFQSRYCNREWRSFQSRAVATGQRTVFGASCYDGEYFPAQAQQLQTTEVKKFFLSFGRGLREAQNYVEFRNAVELLARNTADAACNAPAFQDWPVVDEPQQAPPAPIGLPRL
jgi:TIR domain